MPVFISYSHSDKNFVDQLAMQLVAHNVHVWLDRWELSIGDSLIDKVQQAVEGASALLVILSPDSVESEWCKRELSSGLLRELEEKRVVVMPVLLRDCAIPIFARGKFYADFRTDFDAGLRVVLEGISKVTSASLARLHGDSFHVDWSISSGVDPSGNAFVKSTFVQIPNGQPYTCLTEVFILLDEDATEKHNQLVASRGREAARLDVWETLCDVIEPIDDLRSLLEDAEEKAFTLGADYGEGFLLARITSRRIGEDTGRDVLLNVSSIIHDSRDQMRRVLGRPAEA